MSAGEGGENYKDMFKEARKSIEYWTEVPFGDFTEELCRVMAEKKISQAGLAERIGCSEEYVKGRLGGKPSNATLAGMVRLAMALDSRVRIHLEPMEAE